MEQYLYREVFGPQCSSEVALVTYYQSICSIELKILKKMTYMFTLSSALQTFGMHEMVVLSGFFCVMFFGEIVA